MLNFKLYFNLVFNLKFKILFQQQHSFPLAFSKASFPSDMEK